MEKGASLFLGKKNKTKTVAVANQAVEPAPTAVIKRVSFSDRPPCEIVIPLFTDEEGESDDDEFNANNTNLKVDGIRQEGSAELGKQGCYLVLSGSGILGVLISK